MATARVSGEVMTRARNESTISTSALAEEPNHARFAAVQRGYGKDSEILDRRVSGELAIVAGNRAHIDVQLAGILHQADGVFGGVELGNHQLVDEVLAG